MKSILYLILILSIISSCISTLDQDKIKNDQPALTYLDGQKLYFLGLYSFSPFSSIYSQTNKERCEYNYFELTLLDSSFYVIHADTIYNEGKLTNKLIEEAKGIIDSIPINYLDKIYSIGVSHPQYLTVDFNSTDGSYNHSILNYTTTCAHCPKEVQNFFTSIYRLNRKLALFEPN